MKNPYDTDAVESARELQVVKRDDMIQHARHSLDMTEQRIVLYAISKIKAEDKTLPEIEVNLKELYKVCGIASESYTRIKKKIKSLADKSWWIKIKDKDKEEEVLMRWFSKVRISQSSGKVTLIFDPDMQPFLLNLVQQSRDGTYFTTYMLKYVLPMQNKYSSRLYELLKSYQKNNIRWVFQYSELKYLLNCAGSYTKWSDFCRRVLNPSIAEICEYSDLQIYYDTKEIKKDGIVDRYVVFYMLKKSTPDLIETQAAIDEALGGPIHERIQFSQAENDFNAAFAANLKREKEYQKNLTESEEWYRDVIEQGKSKQKG